VILSASISMIRPCTKEAMRMRIALFVSGCPPEKKMEKHNDETVDETRYRRGLAKLAELGGDAGEEIAPMGDLGRYIAEFGLGDIYSRAGLSLRDREFAAVAMLTAMGGRDPQVRYHLGAALHVGVTAEELEELIIQTCHSPGSRPRLMPSIFSGR
jgi:4-carboxymuconolactone decarboxylase